MTNCPYEIYSYSINKLKNILVEKSNASFETIERKLHSIYFENYFDYLQAKTILVENSYVDRDYMEDFAGYYVRCLVTLQLTESLASGKGGMEPVAT
jgi:hypothetical protein